jgi:hypothetical protein
MSSRSVSEQSFEQHVPQVATLGWALRRAALGLAILFAAAALGAWLMHASIEQDPSSRAHNEYAMPAN